MNINSFPFEAWPNPSLPPADLMAEQVVLGALLAFSIPRSATATLRPKHFADTVHGAIFKAISEAPEWTPHGNRTWLQRHLQKSGALEDVGGSTYLDQLSAAAGSDLQVPAAVASILQTYRRRVVLEIAERLTALARE
ncbi:DnaB-like helicase N-terminal domain-containing protein [Falsiroseomonas sp. HC035]|uniref:DnaB-like helicase N-terminal domain-containing protein n=1 Tax=Falsiroseomonas sp. HC035 TaxID=3390999 RepID=UPI003D3155D8